ncbi:hypothetical protein BDF19DRAFT_495660 [Syncephalis fuscata]|nr:hypothetical protein BDF19DRAFT_495660 [Syncephalis fuscata]
MAESNDSFDLFAEASRDREWQFQDEGSRDLKRTSGVITPDAKELCTKKLNTFTEEDYSSDEAPTERRKRQQQQQSVSLISSSLPSNNDTLFATVNQHSHNTKTDIPSTSSKTTATTMTTASHSNQQSPSHQHVVHSGTTNVNTNTSISTATSHITSTSSKGVDESKDMLAPVAISVYNSNQLPQVSPTATTATAYNETTTTTQQVSNKNEHNNSNKSDNNSNEDSKNNNDEDEDDKDETASCASSTPTEIVDYESHPASMEVSSTSNNNDNNSGDSSISTLDRIRHVAESITAALRPKVFPKFFVRDFAYPDNDPRHKGIYPRPVSAYRMTLENDQTITAEDNAMIAAFNARPTSSSSTSSSTDKEKGSRIDDSRDEYTGPAKAIHDFYAEDPKDVLFKAGEECWIDRQLSRGVLLTVKNGQRCHVRESHLEFTNHE